MIERLNDLTKRVEALEAENAALRGENTALRKENAELRAKLKLRPKNEHTAIARGTWIETIVAELTP